MNGEEIGRLHELAKRLEGLTKDTEAWYAGTRARTHNAGLRGGTVSLEMRTECERCGTALAEDGPATICSYECTFCASCAADMGHVCPNCGGELVARPRRLTEGPRA